MIASIDFHRFKALRETRLEMRPCNLVLGPNGSGKTSLIEAVLQLRGLARLEETPAGDPKSQMAKAETVSVEGKAGPVIRFGFMAPYGGVAVRLSCVSESKCDRVEVTAGESDWPAVRAEIARARSFVLDHLAMGKAGNGLGVSPPSSDYGAASKTDALQGGQGGELAGLARDGGNLAAVLAALQAGDAPAFAALTADFKRVMPEFGAFVFTRSKAGSVGFGVRLADEDVVVRTEELSQGFLYLLALLAVAHHPRPPSVVCFEDVDRGIHPRLLREVRDALYRLSYPGSFGLARAPVQVIATTHSPHLLDLFRDHPEEVVISHKHGSRAHFARLSERTDLGELLHEASLGDLWLTGILGGMPQEEEMRDEGRETRDGVR